MRKLMEATASSPARSRNPSSIVRSASASQDATASRMRRSGSGPAGAEPEGRASVRRGGGAVLRRAVGEGGAGDDDGATADPIDGAADGLPQLEVLAGREERYVHGSERGGGHSAAQAIEREGDGPIEAAGPAVGCVQRQLGAAGFLAHRLDEIAIGLEAQADLGRAPAGEVAL